MSATAKFTELFEDNVRKHSSIKKAVKDKVRIVITHPLHGEPLKNNLLGLFSYPVAGNFLIIYAYCKDCRLKEVESMNGCADCEDTDDETVAFITLGPHDDVYEKMAKFRKLGTPLIN